MADFCPDGYLPIQEAVAEAAETWFRDKFTAIETATSPRQQTDSNDPIDVAVRVFSQPQFPDQLQREFKEIAFQTYQRLRNFLHQGTIKAYYFDSGGCHSSPTDFWTTSHADGVLESGTYWPFGPPTRLYEQRPSFALFVKASELDALLSEESHKKPFPRALLPKLTAAHRSLNHLTRERQREALRDLPEFRAYHITDKVLREVEKDSPREAGRRLPRNQ
jgi:hypothetical protein